MKKIMCAFLSIVIIQGALPTASALAANMSAEPAFLTAVSSSKADEPETNLDENRIFVAVGTLKLDEDEYPEFRYLYTNDKGDLTYYGRVISTDKTVHYEFGDILTCENEPVMTKELTAPDDSTTCFAVHYVLDENTVLKKVGNCAECMEKKALSCYSTIYPGSGYFELVLRDTDETTYPYNFNKVASSFFNRFVTQFGNYRKTFIFAFYKNIPIIPFLPQSKLGDFSNDDKILLDDVLSVAEIYNNSLLEVAQPTPEQLETADIDGNCKIDLTDVLVILQYYNFNELLGMDVSYQDILANNV